MNRFISWLYFPYNKEIQDYELKLIEEVLAEISMDYLEVNIDTTICNQKIFNYSYLINKTQYNQLTNNSLIVHKPDNYIYTVFSYALKNIIRFIDYKEISFEEIKSLNEMDIIFVPDLTTKKYFENKNLEQNKIIVLPLPILNKNLSDKYIEHFGEKCICDINYFKSQIKNIFNSILVNYYQAINKFENKTGFLSYKDKLKKLKEQSENSIILEDMEKVKDLEIINQINHLSKNHEYLILSFKSEFYDYKNRTKEYIISILSGFKIVQESYYGSDELRLDEKEMILVVIESNDYNNPKKYITWEGSHFFHNSLAVINREIELKILEHPKKYELAIIPRDYYQEINSENYKYYDLLKNNCHKILLKKNDFYIRHVLPTGYTSPESGYYILIFPWEYGHLPEELVSHINQQVDQVWCPSNYVKDIHIQNGLLESKLKVIPNGINPDIFNPDIKPIEIKTKNKFRFLFLGGLVYRKGIDILLEAYTEEFKADEDVCLVIKGLAQESYYEQDSITKKIRDVINDKNKPELFFIENNFNIEDMGKVYKSCHCYVHPYRGEGFCMPIAEAMACGLPVIVPNYGPVIDFCNEENSYLIDYQLKKVKDKELDETVIVCEVDKSHLKRLMREVFENYNSAEKVGKEASKVINYLNWDNVFSLIETQFNSLNYQPVFRENIESYKTKIANEIESAISNKDFSDLNYLADTLEKISEQNIHFKIIGEAYYYTQNYKKAVFYFTKVLKDPFITDSLKKNNTFSEMINKLSDIMKKLGDTETSEKLRNI